jgi:hypothetical protein
VDKGILEASLKFLWFKSWGLTQLEQKPAKNNDRAANRSLLLEYICLNWGW